MKRRRQAIRGIRILSLALSGLMPIAVRAQNTLSFSTSDAGQTKSISDWGVDVSWPSSDNMRQSIPHLGVDQIDVIRLNFFKDEALQADGSIGPNSKARIDTMLSIAAMAGNKPLSLSPDSGDATDASYLNGAAGVNVANWVNVIKATQAYIDKPIAAIEPFNEPDYWPGEGTPQNLNDIMAALHNTPVFQNTALMGGSTLNSSNAQGWYDAIAANATHGTTHQLAGTADSYVNFIQHVQASGDLAYNPEIHSMAEVLYGAQYGLEGGIWWGPVLNARGLLFQSVQGKRLGYAEDRASQTVAAVYRSADGNLRAFASGFERTGASAAYRFISTDRDVYFNGVGPLREFMMPVGPGQEGYDDIQFGANPLPALDGNRWKIVNRQTGAVMEVTGGAGGDGAPVDDAADSGALYQRWNMTRDPGGYYALFNANSGRTLDVTAASLNNSATIDQYGMADTLVQQWYLESAGNGYYYLRNGNSNRYLSSSVTNSLFQYDKVGNNLQQWQFVAANPAVNGSLKARFKFDGNASDSSGGGNTAVTHGSVAYGTGPTGNGQAITLNGTNAYATLPSGVAGSSDITIAANVKWTGGNAWQRIFDFGNNTSSYLFLTPLSGAGTMRFAITTGGNTAEQILDTDPLPSGQWVHLAVTLSGNTGVLYVNGRPRVAGRITLNPSDINPTLNYLGKSQFSADPVFAGSIDDFRIYDYALAQSQIAGLLFRRWTGAVNASWTAATQANPKNWQFDSASADYLNATPALFDDTAGGFTVSIADSTVTPTSVLFDNAVHNYVLSGPGAIAGGGTLTKTSAAALTITNANTYTGGTVLNGGTLNLNNAAAIGSGPLTIYGGTTIDNTSGSPITLSNNVVQTWAGDFTFGGSNPLNFAGGGGGAAAVTLTSDRTVTVNGAGTFTVGAIGESGGSHNLTKAGPGTLALMASPTYTGATMAFAGKLLLNASLTTSSSLQATGGTIELAAGGNKIIKTRSVSASNSGRIDLQDNKLAVVGGDLTTIDNLVAAGRNGGGWDGLNGIMTSQSQADTNYTALGVAGAKAGQVFGGQTLASGDVMVMYTYGGDATLDGKINIDDYIRIDQGIASGLRGWSNGDFNYDGKINIDDYTQFIDANIVTQGAPFPTASGATASSGPVSAVPEPTSMGFIAMIAVIANRRARRVVN